MSDIEDKQETSQNKLLLILFIFVIVFSMFQEAYGSTKIKLTPFQKIEREFNSLSIKQHNFLVKVYQKAAPYHINKTLTAIVWKESSAGKYRINPNNKNSSMDCSAYMINTYSALNRQGKKKSRANSILMCQDLLEDEEFAFMEAVTTIKWSEQMLRKKKEFSWTNVWSSYNTGYNYKSTTGKKYAEDIRLRIRVLEKYINKKG